MPVPSNETNNTSLNTQRYSGIANAENDLSPKMTNSSPSNSLLQTSTNIFIYANNAIVGMIQSFSVNESRTINKIQELGTEGVVQAVPSNTNGGSLNVTRIALYQSTLWNALGLTTNGTPYNPLGSRVGDSDYKNATTGSLMSSNMVFKTLKDQRVPLEIQVRTRRNGSNSADTDFYIETYVDCWLSSYSKSFTVQNITVAETAQIQYADVI